MAKSKAPEGDARPPCPVPGCKGRIEAPRAVCFVCWVRAGQPVAPALPGVVDAAAAQRAAWVGFVGDRRGWHRKGEIKPPRAPKVYTETPEERAVRERKAAERRERKAAHV